MARPRIDARRLKLKLERAGKAALSVARQEVAAGALVLNGAMKAKVQRGPASGRFYTIRGRVHQASAPGEAPATVTGQLARSIVWSLDDDGLGASVGVEDVAMAPYARFLEHGTLKMARRPFVQPSLDENRAGIERAIKDAVRRAVRKAGRA